MVICPDCGKEVPKARFCKNCGARLPEIEEVESVPEEVSSQDIGDVATVEDVDVVSEEVSAPDVGDDESVSEGLSIPVETLDVLKSDEESSDDAAGEEIVPSESVEKSDSIPVTIKSENKNKIKFCPNCGFKLEGTFKFCPNCGVDLEAPISKSTASVVRPAAEKSIILAIILSVIFPGLGQIYLGLDRKGALFLIGYVVSIVLILILIGFILCLVIWLWALVDTIQSTNALNRGENVEDKLF